MPASNKSPLTGAALDALFAAPAKRSTVKNAVTGTAVDDLFAGKGPAPEVLYDPCDNCGVTTHEILVFGGDSGFELPVARTSPLDVELQILRTRHHRREIKLCYACTDVLEEPVGRAHRKRVVVNVHAATPPRDEMPRLFAVER